MDLKVMIDKAHAYDTFVEDIQEFEQYKNKMMKLADDRLEYGYDSICLRIEAMVTELATLKAHDKTSNHYQDVEYWRHYYGNRAVRIYDILDDLLDRKGHSSSERTREKMKNGTNN